MRTLAYWIVHFGLKPIVLGLARLSVEGLENLPRKGACIIASNHLSQMDPPFLSATFPLHIRYMTKQELFNLPLVSILFHIYGAVPVRRFEADLKAVRQAIKLLQSGKVVGMFPEGTRSHKPGLSEGQPGTAIIALRSGVPIVPVAVAGSEAVSWLGFILKRPRVKIVVGKPFTLPKVKRFSTAEVQRSTDIIMGSIAALLPEEYRGAYGALPATPAGETIER